MSYLSSVASSSAAFTVATTGASNLRPFADLNLIEDQRTQIRSIFRNAKSQGLSQTQVQQQIEALLTPQQQAQFQTDVQNAANQNGGSPPPPTGGSSGASDGASDRTANLSLTDSQKTQIDRILQQAQSGTITQAQALSQINTLLTQTQQTALKTDVQTAQTQVSGHHHHHHGDGDGTSPSTSALPNGVTETDIQNQVAAATSLILNQLQNDLATT